MRPLALVAAVASILLVTAPPAGTRPEAAAELLLELGSVACYEGGFGEFASRSVVLSDRFGSLSARVGRPDALCYPATLNDEAGRRASALRIGLTCFPIRTGRRPAPQELQLTNAVSRVSVTLVRAQTLCLASSVAKGDVLRRPSSALAHFACYSVRQRGSLASARAVVTDTIGKGVDLLVSAASLCVPATINGSPRIQSRLLTCYGVRSRLRAGSAVVWTAFGVLTASLGTRETVCAASSETGR